MLHFVHKTCMHYVHCTFSTVLMPIMALHWLYNCLLLFTSLHSMAISKRLLKAKYTVSQYAGAGVVALGTYLFANPTSIYFYLSIAHCLTCHSLHGKQVYLSFRYFSSSAVAI
jgi:hypothetical protein